MNLMYKLNSKKDIDWKKVARTVMYSRAIDNKEERELVPEKKILYQFSARGHELGQVLLGTFLNHPKDAVSAYYRSRPLMLSLGLSLEDSMASPMGKSGGYSDGRDIGVVCNMPGRSKPSVLPMAGDVGSQYTPAVGWAQAIEYRRKSLCEDIYEGAISVVLGGDGSVATNGFWSALTISTTLQLPVLFFIEDNGYGISVPAGLQTPGGNIAKNLYSFKNIRIFDGDGTLPDEASSLIGQSVDYVRERKGPVLIRLSVPRLQGHSFQDNQSYKDSQFIKEEKKRDPLNRLKNYMVPDIISEDEWDELSSICEVEVNKAAVKALNRPNPDRNMVKKYVFAETGQDGNYELPEIGGLASEGYSHPDAEYLPEQEKHRITMVEAIRRTLDTELGLNDKLVVFGEDVGAKGGVHAVTLGLQAAHGEDRVFDTSLSEEGIIGRAVGMAYAGLMPVTEIQFRKYADPATEQLKNCGTIRWRTANRFAAPIVVRMPGGFAKCGDPWHSETNEAFFAHMVGWQVAVPGNAGDAVGLLRFAMRSKNPTIFFEHRNMLDSRYARRPYPGDRYLLDFGKANILREGKQLTIITWGAMCERCEKAVNNTGIDGEILDLRTLVPWDRNSVLSSVKKTSRCLIVHEDSLTAGFGAEISAFLVQKAFQYLDAPIERVTMPDIPVPYNIELMNAVLPGVETISERMEKLIEF